MGTPCCACRGCDGAMCYKGVRTNGYIPVWSAELGCWVPTAQSAETPPQVMTMGPYTKASQVNGAMALAGGTNAEMYMPYAGSVVAIALQSATGATGAASATVTKLGVAGTLSVTATNSVANQAAGIDTFGVLDSIGVTMLANGDTGTLYVAYLWIVVTAP